ncbi:MAG: phenylalanine--tRNA ligase subunit beta [Chloroflexota bacterium]|nr:phenylalanine--tRNA ligase subunit beta [Chloroflexota bacterium]
MRVPLSWLKDYVDITLSPEELAHTLTMAGLEVEAVEYVGAAWGESIVTAQIIHLEKVPDSDHLSYTRVTTGHEELGVICGAPNIRQGDKVPLAMVGATVGDLLIGEKRAMGYLSQGMLCSPRELGLGNDHSGIYILDPQTPLGLKLVDVLGEVVLDFAIKAHRGDLSSVIGIAREVAALTGQQVRIPQPAFQEQGPPATELVQVTVEDADLCPRYSARVISNIKIGPSPSWMGRRLLAAGMRPINNIVDITNYVMLEFGQPLHGFDYDLVRQQHIIVRRAHAGEAITTLDDVKRTLRDDMLLITDPQGPTAIAGVMGAAVSEVNDQTTRVLLEAANFKAASVRRTSVALGLRSESSGRFEKGLDPELGIAGANRAAQLMAELAGGTVNPGIVDVYPQPVQPRTIAFSIDEVEWLTGMKVTQNEVIDALSALNFTVEVAAGGTRYEHGRVQQPPLQVTVPTYRTDIHEGADLVEEVLRMIGYDKLPSTIPVGPLPEPQIDSWFEREHEVRTILIGAGLNEIVTYAMTSRPRMINLLAHADAASARYLLQAPNGTSASGEMRGRGAVDKPAHEHTAVAAQPTSSANTALAPFDARSIPAVALSNPLSSDMEAMRLTLMSGLLETVQENSKRNRAGLRFFEVGRRYLPSSEPGSLPDERRSVGIALCGPAEISWSPELARAADFYDLKGVLEALLDRLHIKRYRFTPTQHPTFHPGRCALLELPRLASDGQETFSPAGVLGEVHPLVQQRYDLPHRAYLCELDLEMLYTAVPHALSYEPISRHQELTRDLAIVVDQQVPTEAIKDEIARNGGELLRSVLLFDVYTGDPIPADKKNLTYSLTYQAQDRTLKDSEANAIQERIVSALNKEFGAVLR